MPTRLEKALGRKITPADKAKNDARMASLKREQAVTPGDDFVDHMAKRGLGTKLYRDPATRRWTKRRPETPNPEWRLRYRANDGHGNLTKAAQAVFEAYKPAWREGTNRALGNPVAERETRVARGLVGVIAHGLTEKEAAQYCERCELRKAWCECPR